MGNLLTQAQKYNKSLSLRATKAEQHSIDLSTKLEESIKSINRLQALLVKREGEIIELEKLRRDLEQLHDAGEEKLRQVEFAEAQACEQRDEAEESYVLLLCEMEGAGASASAGTGRPVCCGTGPHRPSRYVDSLIVLHQHTQMQYFCIATCRCSSHICCVLNLNCSLVLWV